MVNQGSEVIATGPPNPLRLYILSHPRTASNLFCKLFSEHPKVEPILYPFLYAYFAGPNAQIVMQTSEVSPEAAQRFQKFREMLKDSTYQYVLDKMERDIANAESAVCPCKIRIYDDLVFIVCLTGKATDAQGPCLLFDTGSSHQGNARETPRNATQTIDGRQVTRCSGRETWSAS